MHTPPGRAAGERPAVYLQYRTECSRTDRPVPCPRGAFPILAAGAHTWYRRGNRPARSFVLPTPPPGIYSEPLLLPPALLLACVEARHETAFRLDRRGSAWHRGCAR